MAKGRKRRILIGSKLTVTRQANGEIIIDYAPKNPPQIFFDTNVLLGLNPDGISALRKLQVNRRFTYRYSMLNFVELASHLGDEATSDTPNPFRKYQAAFKKISSVFDLKPLPSAETVFMKAVGLYHYLGPSWQVNEEEWANNLTIIANAHNLAELRERKFSPEHYKEVRKQDETWFLKFIEKAREIGNLPTQSEDQILSDWGKLLGQFYAFLIYRASSAKKTFSSLGMGEQKRVIKFFEGSGGAMFLMHFVHLLKKILRDHRKEDANDFYDMLQLILLKDENLLFVSDDRPFHQYYGGPKQHRVVSWKMFQATASLP